jgi:hypothetical protein
LGPGATKIATMDAPSARGSPGPLPPLQPGNGEPSEHFPELCLQSHQSRASTPTSSRYSTISTTSTVSTAPSCADSLYHDPDWPLKPSPSTRARPRTCSELSATTGTPRTRRDKQELHAARQQRSDSRSSRFTVGPSVRKPATPGPHSSASPSASPSSGRRWEKSTGTFADALAAVEPPREKERTKMAFSDQQRWITVQQKTFTKWLNTKLESRDLEVKDLVADLSDGVMLIHLLESLSNESLGRYASKPKLRVQRFENANLALDFIKSRGIQMTNIGAEDVVDGNRKIVLGLIWTLILRFTISDINEEGMSAKEGLLLWCQRKTACYDEVEVRDFSSSWNDGLAFCALLDIHRPDLIDFDSLDKSDHRGNMTLAFDIAQKEIGIPRLLDVEDVCDVAKPDERSLMTYIAYWFHAFSQMEKVENAGRRVEKFVNNMQGAWEMQSAYERRMRALHKSIKEQIEKWQTSKFEGTYNDAKQQANEFVAYKKGQKRDWVAEKSDLATLLGNIKTKLGTYRLRPYDPPADVRGEALEKEWNSLSAAEMQRAQLINETIRE